MKLIITVKEARKLLGKEISDEMTDEQIEQTINLLHSIAKHYIEDEMRKIVQSTVFERYTMNQD